MLHVEVAARGDDPLVEARDGLEEVLLGDLGGPGAVGLERGDVERDLVAVQQRQEVDLRAVPDVHAQVAVGGQAVGVVDVDDDAVGVLAGEHRLLR